MKKTLFTATALALLSGPALAEGSGNVNEGGVYPFLSGVKKDCVVWAIVPFGCHEGFDYEEPGGPVLVIEEEPEEELIEDAAEVEAS